MTGVAIGIDVGGTKIAGAIVDRAGVTHHEATIATPRSEAGADPGAAASAELVASLTRHATEARLQLVGVGVGVPEYVDRRGRRTSRLVLDWPCDPFEPAPTHVPVTIDSDVRCAALAESRLGHGVGAPSCLFVSIGTGISHTLVIDGRIWTGERGEAIALGELRVSPDDGLLPDAPTTVEGQASGNALEQVATRRGLSPLADHPDLDAARERAGRTVAAAIADVVAILDPAIVVVGGGLGTRSGAFADSLNRCYRELTTSRSAPPPLLTSALGDRAGRIGAALLAHGS